MYFLLEVRIETLKMVVKSELTLSIGKTKRKKNMNLPF